MTPYKNTDGLYFTATTIMLSFLNIHCHYHQYYYSTTQTWQATTHTAHYTLPSLIVTSTTINTSHTTHTYTHTSNMQLHHHNTTTITTSTTTTTLPLPSLLLYQKYHYRYHHDHHHLLPHRQTKTEREEDKLQEETVLGEFLACSMQGASLRLVRFKHYANVQRKIFKRYRT